MEIETRFFQLPGKNGSDEFILANGSKLIRPQIAYQVYGQLNEAGDNGILVFHALSGSQHVAGSNVSLSKINPFWNEDCHIGWWDNFVGPQKAIDTNQYCVICANYLGGCYGSTGPSSLNPESGKPYGSSFPHIAVNDIVDSQVLLLKHLGILKLKAVFGPSLGAMLALNVAVRYPHLMGVVVLIAGGLSVTMLQRLMRFEQIRAIELDPNFRGGDYYDGELPSQGLSLARAIAHKAYVSLSAIERRAARDVKQMGAPLARYRLTHAAESYLLHQGNKFVKRFDANSYLVIAEAWQKYDLVADAQGESLSNVLSRLQSHRFLVFSIDSDVCFYPEEQTNLVGHLREADVICDHVTVCSDKGHDAFLLEPDLFSSHVAAALSR